MKVFVGTISKAFMFIALLPLMVWISCYWYRSSALCLYCDFSFPLSEYVTTTIMQTIQSPGNRFKNARLLLEQFNVIKAIDFEYAPQGFVCEVSCFKPIFIMNNIYVVLTNRAVVAPELFQELQLQTIAHITNEQPIADCVAKELYDCITTIDLELKEQFTVTWRHARDVLYCDKINTQYALQARSDQIITPQMIQHYHTVIALHKTRPIKKKNHVGLWIIDIRFDNQIILCAQKGGQGYGKINA